MINRPNPTGHSPKEYFRPQNLSATLKVGARAGDLARTRFFQSDGLLGHCTVIGLSGVSSHAVQRWLNWHHGTPGAQWLRRACGALLIVASGYLLMAAR